jgi:hypothetical protein
MAAAGGYGPMPVAAIFADTGDEPFSVYRWLDWLEKQLPFPVYRVTTGKGKLSDEATRLKLSAKSGNTYIPIGLPVYTVEKVTQRPIVDWEEVADDEFGFDEEEIRGEPEEVIKNGMGRRQCTRTFKIEPIRRKLRELAKGERVVQWIGISADEIIRMKPSRDKWCDNIWPLVELGMTRADCLQWMVESGYPTPPRSACTYCPYHSDAEWLRLKNDEPTEFAAAVEFEHRLQQSYEKATALRATPFLHASRQPLSQVVFKPKPKQPSLFGNECEGICGV